MKASFRFVKQALIVIFCTALLVIANLAFNSAQGAADTTQATSSNNGSPNWAGYVATDRTFVKVEGDITVPTITCTVPGAESLFWVGFDGYGTNTVEQDGVGAKCNGTTPSYFTWWEMFNPATGSLHQIATSTISVKPGQQVEATVNYAAVKQSNGKTVGEYELQVANLTTKQKPFTTDQVCAAGYTCGRSTAEWIAERYDNGNGTYLPLGKWAYNEHLFTGAYAAPALTGKYRTITNFNTVELSMLNSNFYFLAVSNSLNTGGTSFGVNWAAAE